MPTRYAVVIPVFNERTLFPRLLERLVSTPPVSFRGPGGGDEALERHVIVIDDGSTDGTRGLVESLRSRGDERIHPVLHRMNQGKGAAVRAGFDAALALGAEIVLIQDADLEYDPRDHAKLLEPIIDGRADAVFGSRFLGDTHRVLYYWHAVANRCITTCSNMLTNLNLTDIECCLKAFTRPVVERISIEENRFGVEPELVAKVARLRLPGEAAAPGGFGGVRVSPLEAGSVNATGASASGVPTGAGRAASRPVRVYEVGVSYAGRTYEEGKKITWRDGVSALRCIVTYGLG